MVSIVNKYFLPVSGTLAVVALSMSIVAEEIDSSAFSMQIMDVFTITDRGTVMTGQVKSGSISAGDTVCIPLTNGEIAPSTIESIEMHRKQLERAEKGQFVGLLVAVDKKLISKGALLHSRC